MNCIFCKEKSDESITLEHIIPESLGNKRHVLFRGLVCDKCNNYFSIKIEKPLLEQPYFKSLRHRHGIANKKGNPIIEKGIIPHPEGGLVNTFIKNGVFVIDVPEGMTDLMLSGKINKVYTPFYGLEPEKENKVLSRFLTKVAIEALLYKLIDIEGWIDEVMQKCELDLIKRYARYGEGTRYWPYNQRKLYDEDQEFINVEKERKTYQVLHEFDFFWTKEGEFYFVIAIMGIEYAINLVYPSIATYESWIAENNGKSILEDEREKRIKL